MARKPLPGAVADQVLTTEMTADGIPEKGPGRRGQVRRICEHRTLMCRSALRSTERGIHTRRVISKMRMRLGSFGSARFARTILR